MSQWLQIILAAIVASVVGYLLNQLPAIPSFPHRGRWVAGAVVLVIALSVLLAEHPPIPHAPLMTGAVGVITVAVILILIWLARKTGKQALPDENGDGVRSRLLQRLENDIHQRRASALHNLIKIDLQLEDQPQQVGQPNLSLVPEDSLLNRSLRVFEQSTPTVPLSSSQKVIEVFRRSDIQDKLLILGEPGAGKTTELLTLAQDLVQQAIADESAAIPIIFELSSWKEDKPIEQWLVEQITEVYKLPASIGKQWLETQQLLPLLDGLDELGLVRQRKCVEFVNRFLEDHKYFHLVVCCRREEYEQGELQLERLKGAVYLQPLTNEQIKNYFEQLNRSYLWQVVEQTPELLALARLPLFATMIPYAYQRQMIHSSRELFENYIAKRLAAPESQGVYPPGKAPSKEQTRHYIVWLARQLEAHHSTEFLIERLQPDWLDSVEQKRLYRELCILIFWLLFGLFFGLSSGLLFGLSVGLGNWLIVGLSVGLLFGLIETIDIVEQLQWSWKKAINRLLFGLSVGLLFGLFFGLSSGLLFGLTVGLGSGLSAGLSGLEIENKTAPNQGIGKSATNAVILMLSVGLSAGLSVGLSVGLGGGLSVGLGGGLIVGLSAGGLAVIQHCTLRVILYHDRCIPWNYAKFLDHAVKHRFIQRVGGRYRFMHDLLRKHFAQMPLE